MRQLWTGIRNSTPASRETPPFLDHRKLRRPEVGPSKASQDGHGGVHSCSSCAREDAEFSELPGVLQRDGFYGGREGVEVPWGDKDLRKEEGCGRS